VALGGMGLGASGGLSRLEDAQRVEIALARIDEAQRMAGQLSQDPNALAADAGTVRIEGGTSGSRSARRRGT
jgi:hypothetical protein